MIVESPAPASLAAAPRPPVQYHLDDRNRITWVNDEWTRFADANDGERLVPEAVIGRPLRDFVVGDVSRMFVDTLIQSVRLTGRARSVAYRCDSPDAKRYMSMELCPGDDGAIVSSHRVVREERLAVPTAFVAAFEHSKTLLKRCSMCNRLARKDSGLLEPDAAAAAGWLSDPKAVLVIYFVCTDCQQKVAGIRVGA